MRKATINNPRKKTVKNRAKSVNPLGENSLFKQKKFFPNMSAEPAIFPNPRKKSILFPKKARKAIESCLFWMGNYE